MSRLGQHTTKEFHEAIKAATKCANPFHVLGRFLFLQTELLVEIRDLLKKRKGSVQQ